MSLPLVIFGIGAAKSLDGSSEVMLGLLSLERGQLKHYLQATFYEHSKHESTSGAQHFIPNLDMKEPARFLIKPLSLLITDVLCRQGGNLWYFMHSQFRWSSSPLSLSVVLKWQHHYCLFEHSGDMASFPLAWWNRGCKKRPAVSLSGFRHGYLRWFSFYACECSDVRKRHPQRLQHHWQEIKEEHITVQCLINKRAIQRHQKNDKSQKTEIQI